MAAPLPRSAFDPGPWSTASEVDVSPPGSTGPRRGPLRAVLAGLAIMVVIGGWLGSVSPVPPVAPGSAAEELAAAEDAYDAALAAQRQAGDRLDRARVEAARTELELRGMTDHQQAVILAYESTLSRARDMAVAAYVRGGAQADLHAYLDANLANEAILRIHLAAGRVDQAEEAAAELRTARQAADEEVLAQARTVAEAAAELADAERAADDADEQAAAAYEALLAADQAAAAEVAQAAAEARQRAAEEAAAEAAAANAAAEASADEAAAEAPSTPARRTVVAPAPRAGADDGWAQLVECESGGNYAAVSANGRYRGAYQFDQDTWESLGGGVAHAAAPPEEQDMRARMLYERSGSRPWPLCGRHLP